MVHALQETHRVLRPGGSLVDLRPAQKHRRVELELAGARLQVGEIDSSDIFGDHVAADAALDSMQRRGLLRAEHDASFDYLTEMDTADDLQAFAATLRRSVLPAAVLRKIETLTADETAGYLIRIRREIRIARYQRL